MTLAATNQVGTGTLETNYYQPGQTVRVTFSDASNNQGKRLQLDATKILLNGRQVEGVTVSGNVLSFPMPEALGGFRYILSLEEGAIYYSASMQNTAQDIVLRTPAIYDGLYFMRTKVGEEPAYLSRANDYGTRAVLDDWGLPVRVSTSGQNVTQITFEDSNKNLYAKTEGSEVYTDYSVTATNSQEWTITRSGSSYRLTSAAHAEHYLRYDAGQSGWKSLYSDGNYLNGTIIDWTFQSPAAHRHEMDSLRALLQQPAPATATYNYLTSHISNNNPSEHYNGHNSGQAFNTQVMSGNTVQLMPGLYKFVMPAFVRMAAKEATYALHTAQADCPAAYLYFGSQKVQLHSLFDEALSSTGNNGSGWYMQEGKYYADNLSAARYAFKQGLYRNEIWLQIDRPMSVEYGIIEQGNPGNNSHWICWTTEGIELTRYSDERFHIGAPTAQSRCVEAGSTVSISFADICTNEQGAWVSCNFSGVTLNGEPLSVQNDARGFHFQMPALAAGVPHTLHIPANQICYMQNGAVVAGNEAADLQIFVRVLADGYYFVRTEVEGQTRYLSRGNTYGTRAILDSWGLPLYVTTDSENVTRLQYVDTQGYLYSTSGNAYTDYPQPGGGGTPDFTIVPVGESFRLVSAENPDCQLRWEVGSAGSQWQNVLTDGTDSQVISWSFERPAAHQTAMNALRQAALEHESVTGLSTKSYLTAAPQTTKEQFNTYDVGGDAVQGTTKMLMKGIYRFSVRAFYRMAGTARAGQIHEAQADCPPVYLYIGDKKVQLHSVYDYQTSGRTPNSQSDALQAFKESDGQGGYKYENVIWFKVEENTRLRYGITKQGKPGQVEQWLCWSPESFSLTCYFDPHDVAYFVGDPSAENCYAQPGDWVTLTCYDAYATQQGATFGVNSTSGLLFDGAAVSSSQLKVVDNNICFQLPQGVAAGTEHTLTVPEGAFVYKDNRGTVQARSNRAEVTVRTPEVYDGTYFLQTRWGSQTTYLSRGNNWSTRATVDDFGLAVELTTNSDNHTLIRYLDNDRYLFLTNEQEVYGDKGYTDNEQLLWSISASTDGYHISNVLLPQYCLSQSSADNNLYADRQGIAFEWRILTPAQHAAQMQALKDSLHALSKQVAGMHENNTSYNIRFSSGVDELFQGGTGATRLNGQFVATAPGIYHVSVKGFARLADRVTTYNLHSRQCDSPAAYFQFGDAKLQLASLFDASMSGSNTNNTYQAPDGKRYPDGTQAAQRAFEAGLYSNDIWLRIDNAGVYDFVLYNVCSNNGLGGNWLCWSNDVVSITRYYTDAEGDDSDREDKINVFEKGDVNFDGRLNDADLRDLTEMVLGSRLTTITAHIKTLNGQADIRDLSELYNLINCRNVSSDDIPTGTDNYLHLQPATVDVATPVTLAMAVTHRRSAWQMDLDLPEGFTLDEVALGADANVSQHVVAYHQLATQRSGYNSYRLLMVSPEQAPLSGQVLQLTLTAAEGLAEGLYPVYARNVMMDDASTLHQTTQIASATSYLLVGNPQAQLLQVEGELSAHVVAAINSTETVGSIDLTGAGVTVCGTLQPANPNALIFTNEPLGYFNEVVNGELERLQLVDGHSFTAPWSFHVGEVSYQRNMGDQWGTIGLPFDVEIDVTEPYDFYNVVAVNNGMLNVQKISGILPAGTPVILHRNSGVSGISIVRYDLEIMAGVGNHLVPVSDPNISQLELIPTCTFVNRRIDHGFYISGNSFWNATQYVAYYHQNLPMGAFRAFYDYDANSADGIRLGMTETTGIEQVEENETGLLYDLSGMRQSTLKQGFNLLQQPDGSWKKVVVK